MKIKTRVEVGNRTCNVQHDLSADIRSMKIIIIDGCFYSRIACEYILSEFHGCLQVFSFACFTDYKMWSESLCEDIDKYYIIFNAASGGLYGNDVIDFLRYEEGRNDQEFTRTKILILVNKTKPQIYNNAILIHYLLKKNNIPSLAVVSSFVELKVDMIRDLLAVFIFDEIASLARMISRSSRITDKFNYSDLRAMDVLLSGESIRSASNRFGISTKTLYTQRSIILEKLEL